MRYKEFKKFLAEYKGISQAKKDIIQRIVDLDPKDELGAKLLDRIFKVLNSDDIGGKIVKSFQVPTADENFADAIKQKHINNIAEIISRVDTDYKSMNTFLNILAKGQAINLSEFKKPVTSFTAICNNNAVAMKVLGALVGYGAGQKRAGPGEFALAFMSPGIRMAEGQGDIEIDGIGKVELKAETTQGGGRLGMGGPSRDVQLSILEKEAPEIVQAMGSKKSANIPTMVKYMNAVYPLPNAKNKNKRISVASKVLSLAFGNKYGPAMGKYFGTADENTISANVFALNFEHYKAQDDFDALVFINFPMGKIMTAKSAKDILALVKAGQLAYSSGAFIHSGQAGESFGQLKATKIKS
jgi:hypothetical protein